MLKNCFQCFELNLFMINRGIEEKHVTSTAQWYKPTTLERSRGASLSSLNELDCYEDVTIKVRTNH